MSLNKKQLEWARRVYSSSGVLRCYFPVYSEDSGWGFCGSTREVHIHHLVPQGWCRRFLNIDPDYSENLIALCSLHHVGKGYRGSLDHHNDLVPVVHTDMSWCYRNYGKYGRDGFERVFKGREELSLKGQKYWNSDWDSFLKDIAHEAIRKYRIANPSDKFPTKASKV